MEEARRCTQGITGRLEAYVPGCLSPKTIQLPASSSKTGLPAGGYEIILVDNGIDAWKVLQQERPPEVVIVDWSMPGVDGIELCRRLRDKSRSYYHYILMVTSRTDEVDLVHALESGADDCIGKPFGEAELRARLLVASRILALQNELIHTREELRGQAMRDGLTGLWNRTAFFDLFKRELDRANRTAGRTGLLLLDLDISNRSTIRMDTCPAISCSEKPLAVSTKMSAPTISQAGTAARSFLSRFLDPRGKSSATEPK